MKYIKTEFVSEARKITIKKAKSIIFYTQVYPVYMCVSNITIYIVMGVMCTQYTCMARVMLTQNDKLSPRKYQLLKILYSLNMVENFCSMDVGFTPHLNIDQGETKHTDR